MSSNHPSALNERQERFVLEYLIDQNASTAAARAGYNARNMAAQGSELLNHPLISERIRRGMGAVLARLREEALGVMKRRVRAAFFDAGKLFRAGWELVPLEELDEETRADLEIRTVQRKSGPVVTVKQPDRDKALRALERVFEKLEGLDERHYRWAEKAGLVKSLEEIEAMDGGGEGAGEMGERSMVLSGGGEEAVARFAEKGQVLSGGGVEAGRRVVEKDQGLSGLKEGQDSRLAGNDRWGGAGAAGENARGSMVLSGRPLVFGEKHTVLSGGWRAGKAWVGAFAEKWWGLSGLKVGLGSRLRGNDKRGGRAAAGVEGGAGTGTGAGAGIGIGAGVGVGIGAEGHGGRAWAAG